MTAGVVHIDPRSLSLLLAALTPQERALITALLSMDPDGAVDGSERKLAAAAGCRPLDLRALIGRMGHMRVKGEPVITVDGTTVRIARRTGLFVTHAPGAPAAASGPRASGRAAPPVSISAARDAARARIGDEGMAARVDALLAILAASEPDGMLPMQAQTAEYSGIASLVAAYGAGPASAALDAGIRHFGGVKGAAAKEEAAAGKAGGDGEKPVKGMPAAYIRKVAQSEWARQRTSGAPAAERAASDGRRAAAEEPDDRDAF